ncbi:Oral-facial-digital syndrome 1 protein-like protein [Trichoplax sp. H2]|nr:Oral-facial-digital syndrome 1 protein-like protein [Trichoplax sp. H2]|eukprot:RDD39637.1 Oral-facial-digital syndrome 1 protein-like protein [Trichoplax sp. H2]
MVDLEEPTLSEEELKLKLFHNFRQRGILTTLKSQLRKKMVDELQQRQGVLTSNINHSKQTINQLNLDVGNSIICNHLKTYRYDYALSVYLPECNLSEDKVYNIPDIIDFMKFQPNDPFYRKAIALTTTAEQSLLIVLLDYFLNQNQVKPIPRLDNSCQTDQQPILTQEHLNQRLQILDQTVMDSHHTRDKNHDSVEDKLIAMEKEIETRCIAQAKVEMERFENVTLTKMRLEERTKYQQELQTIRNELEQDYYQKKEALRRKEEDTMQHLRNQELEKEAQLHLQRQSILEQLEMVRSKELELKRCFELNEQSQKLESEKARAAEERIRMKETSISNLEQRYQRDLEDNITRHDSTVCLTLLSKKIKLETQEQFIQKSRNLDVREAKLKENLARSDKDEAFHRKLVQEIEDYKSLISQLRETLEGTRQELAVVKEQKEHLRRRIEEVSDYNVLRERLVVLCEQLSNSQKQLEQLNDEKTTSSKEIEKLTHKLLQPSEEVINLRQEVKQLREINHNMRLQHAQQIQQLQAVQQAEIDRNRNIRQRFEEQLLHQREMNREISDLRLALHQAQTALSLQMKRRTQEVDLDRSRPIPDSILNPDRSAAMKSLLKRTDSGDKSILEQAAATSERINRLLAGNSSLTHRESSNDLSHGLQTNATTKDTAEDVESVAINARQKLQKLELQTEAIQRSYRNYLDHGSTASNPTNTHDAIAVEGQPNEINHKFAWGDRSFDGPSYNVDSRRPISTHSITQIPSFSNLPTAHSDAVSTNNISRLTHSQVVPAAIVTESLPPKRMPLVSTTSVGSENVYPEISTSNTVAEGLPQRRSKLKSSDNIINSKPSTVTEPSQREQSFKIGSTFDVVLSNQYLHTTATTSLSTVPTTTIASTSSRPIALHTEHDENVTPIANNYHPSVISLANNSQVITHDRSGSDTEPSTDIFEDRIVKNEENLSHRNPSSNHGDMPTSNVEYTRLQSDFDRTDTSTKVDTISKSSNETRHESDDIVNEAQLVMDKEEEETLTWEEEKRRKEEEQKRLQQEAWEKEQRELELLQQQQQEQERREKEAIENEKRAREEEEQKSKQEVEKRSDEKQQMEDSSMGGVDPVMLHYMELVKKRREESATAAEVSKPSKVATKDEETLSYRSESSLKEDSLLQEDIGMNALSDDEAFDW